MFSAEAFYIGMFYPIIHIATYRWGNNVMHVTEKN
jgi:hypothetical protein